jgi:glycosyltransferase involved in cell wall biosynthesis
VRPAATKYVKRRGRKLIDPRLQNLHMLPSGESSISAPMQLCADNHWAARLSDSPAKNQTVAVIIPTYNHAHFLPQAITSVLAQTRCPDEIIVVDDGSTDDPAAVVSQFPGVRLIRQSNRGRSAARNVGIGIARSSHVVFLDADDRLLPKALELGMACAAKNAKCGFVYGGHRDIKADGSPEADHPFYPVSGDAHLALLRRNFVRMQAAVIFRRDVLTDIGGFDEGISLAEDYDLYLRVAQRHPIAAHSALVAEYRKHGTNTSRDPVQMLDATFAVLDRHFRRTPLNSAEQIALEEGQTIWRAYYAWLMLERAREQLPSGSALRLLSKAVQTSPWTVMSALGSYLTRHAVKVMPSPLVRWINRQRGLADRISVGDVQFGDLRRLTPISKNFGFDRGTPVDRYYIDTFLAKNSRHIHGRVLEAGDDTYTRRFGGKSVEGTDIIHLDATNPRATIVGDLGESGLLPEGNFDCILLTNALHYVFDLRGAIGSLRQALKPGGVLLVTMPGVSGVDDGDWGSNLAWSMTAPLARRLLEEWFLPGQVVVEAYGNVFAATAFLHGVVTEEVTRAELDQHDPRYPVLVGICAVKTDGA